MYQANMRILVGGLLLPAALLASMGGLSCSFDTAGIAPSTFREAGQAHDGKAGDEKVKDLKKDAPCVPTGKIDVCDGKDNNCDGKVDNGATCTDKKKTCCAGSCKNLAANLEHCGVCRKACKVSPANATSTCTAGKCGLKCAAGFNSCDSKLETGCEAELAKDPKHCGKCNNAVTVGTDPKNCGLCGHDCLGGTCLVGVCQPVNLAKAQNPFEMVVDKTSLFWTNIETGTLVRLTLANGQSKVIVKDMDSPRGLASDGTLLFWVNEGDGKVMVAKKDGTGMVSLASSKGQPSGVSVDATHVYWADNNVGGGIWRVGKNGKGLKELIKKQAAPWKTVLDSKHIFWTNTGSGTIGRAEKDGTNPKVMALGQGDPRAIALDNANVYWTNALDKGKVLSLPKAAPGGKVVVLAQNQGKPLSLLVLGSTLWWANFKDGTLMLGSTKGGSPKILVSGFKLPFSLAADSKAVYIATLDNATNVKDGSIWKLAK